MDFNDLTEEQKAKARACKTGDELMQLAKKEGVELSIDQLEDVSGGEAWSCEDKCSGHSNDLPRD